MRTLHRYLLRQIVASLAMSLLVFTFVLLLVTVLREVLPLLVTGKGSMAIVGKALLLAVPYLLSFALPMAMMTATLLVFGRFSADQELTAARASGISLASLVAPVLILSLAFSGLSAWMNLDVAPRCRVAYNDLRTDLKTALLTSADLPEGQYIDDFPGYIIYVGKNRRGNLQDILLHQFGDEKTNAQMSLHAPTARLEKDLANQRIVLHLYDVSGIWSPRQPFSVDNWTINIPLNTGERKSRGNPDISDMTWAGLRAELQRLERRIGQPLLLQTNVAGADPRQQKKALARQLTDITAPLRVEINRRFAFSFACFGFTLIAIPLGIRVQRRETNVNLFVALGLLLLYWILTHSALALTTRPEFFPHLLIWLPGFLFQAIGAVLLWRANRGI